VTGTIKVFVVAFKEYEFYVKSTVLLWYKMYMRLIF